MNDDYKRGLVTGLAMQPLAVVGTVEAPAKEPNYCGLMVSLGIQSDHVGCGKLVKTES